MAPSPSIKPAHKAIAEYYRTLQDTAAQGADHEMAVRRAFRELLATTAKPHGWTIIEEQSHTATIEAGSLAAKVRPDATFRDKNTLPRGYWEAKDTADDLDAEIRKKSKKGYSLVNTIFEDTRTAVLYQNGKEAFRADLAKAQNLADILNQFFSHTEPDFDRWEKAVEDFKDRVPELAKGLVTIVETAHKKNTKFKEAFADFFSLCQTALNPNIAQAAVDEMLIQHILTERLFRTIFNRADFTQRNVIAAEVEKVIAALASQSFSREEYLKALDRFYVAIEHAAKHLDWTDKQHFLNVIYERFFQGYSIKTADTMGIVYTPQPIVDFMCASVAEVLQKEFKKDLGDPDVFILDPCTGTGNFIVNLLRRIPPKKLPKAYAHNLFANEIMLMPYYIAALNIEHAYYELAGKYEPFEGLCFVDTLDIAEHKQKGFDFFTEQNTARVERQKKTAINVVIGNPPYNTQQENENDNNKNRTYKSVDDRIRATYVKGSTATLRSKLYDPYLRFFRWASDRIGNEGVIVLVSNNYFLDGLAFDGVRKHLAKDFQQIWILDLKGNVRKDSMRGGIPIGEEHTVFGLGAMVGVCVSVFIRNPTTKRPGIHYSEVDFRATRAAKFETIKQFGSIYASKPRVIHPSAKGDWLHGASSDEFDAFLPIGNKHAKTPGTVPATLFKTYSHGVSTNRDIVVYDFSREALEARIEAFAEAYNAEIDRWNRRGSPKDLDGFLDYSRIKWSRNLKSELRRNESLQFLHASVREALYRPFASRYLYFADIAIDERGRFPLIFPTAQSSEENLIIALSDIGYRADTYNVMIADRPVDLHLGASLDGHQCFPFYVYDEDGTNRRENITDWALSQFRTHYDNKRTSKRDIFYYVYALLHHPVYREKFADNLKRELPRISFAPDFRAFAVAGKKLADLHLNYESVKPFPLKEIITPKTRRSPRVESKMRLAKGKESLTVNDSLTLSGIPAEAFSYRLGNRSALEWVIDQYQVYTDKRTGITSDPNAWGEEHGNPEYIVELVARVITVSLETQKIVNALPKEYAPPV